MTAMGKSASIGARGAGWIDFICEEHRKFLHHSHQVTNIVIDLDGERAGSESYVTATLRAREGGCATSSLPAFATRGCVGPTGVRMCALGKGATRCRFERTT
jgi:hypothetical protein